MRTNKIFQVGWGSVQQEPAFGGPADNTSVKSKVINLIASVRTLMRSTSTPPIVSRAPRKLTPRLAVPLIVINTLIIVYELILG